MSRVNKPTSNIADSRAAKDSDQLRRGATIVANRDNVTEQAVLAFSHGIKDIHEVVRGTTSGNDDNPSVGRVSHGRGKPSR